MTYRVTYTHKAWVGKPDPSGMGKGTLTSRDPSWIHEQAMKLSLKGCKVHKIERQQTPDGKWETI